MLLTDERYEASVFRSFLNGVTNSTWTSARIISALHFIESWESGITSSPGKFVSHGSGVVRTI
jgi:hypothetical protein